MAFPSIVHALVITPFLLVSRAKAGDPPIVSGLPIVSAAPIDSEGSTASGSLGSGR